MFIAAVTVITKPKCPSLWEWVNGLCYTLVMLCCAARKNRTNLMVHGNSPRYMTAGKHKAGQLVIWVNGKKILSLRPLRVHGGDGLVAKSCSTLATPWTVAHQAPLSMGFPRQEYWNGLPFLSPANLPNPGIEPESPTLLHH